MLISYNKKTDCPVGTACIIIYSPKMEFNEGITRLANSDKPQFTCVNEDLAGERNAIIAPPLNTFLDCASLCQDSINLANSSS